jgi:hypothetical protein
MYFAYFDESGDSGMDAASPTATFSLACVLIRDTAWLDALDQTVKFRKFLKDQFRIPLKAEIKAAWLIHNKGDVRVANLSFSARMAAYMASMRFQRKAQLFKTFSVVIKKREINARNIDPRERAWHFAIQRLERFGSSNSAMIHVIPDEGHADFIIKKIRAMRRFHFVPAAFGGDALRRDARNIVEDASERNSKRSYFIQLADLNAYASFRKVFPSTNFGDAIWDELGDARLAEVNAIRGGPTGIVAWP